jgi:hypothetical protein
MSKTLVSILAVLMVFLALYFVAPAGLPWLGASAQLSGLPREGNGLMGRFMDFVSESSWYPIQFFMGVSLVLAISVAIVFYWKRIQD